MATLANPSLMTGGIQRPWRKVTTSRPTGCRCWTGWRTAPWEGRTHRTTGPLGGRSRPSRDVAFGIELGKAVDIEWCLGLPDVCDHDLTVWIAAAYHDPAARGVSELILSRCPLVLVDQSTQDVATTQLRKGRRTRGSPRTDGMGVPRPRLRCGRCWL
jgi:hypothetical protein